MSRKISFKCENCGEIFGKWSGQCQKCKEWNCLSEFEDSTQNDKSLFTNFSKGKVLSDLENFSFKENKRISTDFFEVDRVLGGGIFPGSIMLLTGNPGIGKSTISLQIAQKISNKFSQNQVVIISGEESVEQIFLRASRIFSKNLLPNLKIFSGVFVEDILATAKKIKPKLLIVDSAQTICSQEVSSLPGTISQIRFCTEKLMYFSKNSGIPILLIGHVNKGGEMAGPQTLAHLVDVVLQIEGEKNHDLRILRAEKNRFGSSSEVGIFEMGESGLVEVKNPSTAFLSGRLPGAIGSVIFPTIEGNRPFLVEIQALTSRTHFGFPKRSASGISISRLNLLIAVLESHTNVKLENFDIFANIVGGFKISEPAADFSVALAIFSAKTKIPISEKLIIIGELGLSGEIRPVSNFDKRIIEAEKMGFLQAFISSGQKISKKFNKIKIQSFSKISEAIEFLKKKSS